MSATMQRGSAVRREAEHIYQTSRSLFEVGDQESRAILPEEQGVFHVQLAALLGVFAVGRNTCAEWKNSIFRGEEEFSEAGEKMMQEFFSIWQSAASLFKERAQFYGRHGLPIDPLALAELQAQMNETDNILRDWTRPGLSQALALRSRQLSPAGETKLRELLSEKR